MPSPLKEKAKSNKIPCAQEYLPPKDSLTLKKQANNIKMIADTLTKGKGISIATRHKTAEWTKTSPYSATEKTMLFCHATKARPRVQKPKP
ncbi:MAG: hypothetical protein N4A36_02675 [Candidatus Gracilibacteria bacterium]|nr:hypothetical protein [Candidatus Gracilibacteria bacterium]